MAEKDIEMNTLVRVRVAAVEFDVSVNALYDAINNGKIKAVRLGKSVRIPRVELDRIAASSSTDRRGYLHAGDPEWRVHTGQRRNPLRGISLRRLHLQYRYAPEHFTGRRLSAADHFRRRRTGLEQERLECNCDELHRGRPVLSWTAVPRY